MLTSTVKDALHKANSFKQAIYIFHHPEAQLGPSKNCDKSRIRSFVPVPHSIVETSQMVAGQVFTGESLLLPSGLC